MVLGTSDVRSSIALAVIPPGNALRDIAAFRGGIFRDRGEASARAWFDFPVLAWLPAKPESADLARAARACVASLSFSGLACRDRALYLCLSPDSLNDLKAAMPNVQPTDEPAPPGPFEAGLGIFCACFASQELAVSACSELEAPSLGTLCTYLLATVDLTWSSGAGYGSSWALTASARCGPRGKGLRGPLKTSAF